MSLYPNSEEAILKDPSTDAYTLSIIAKRRPDLWEEVYVHPNTDVSWREEIERVAKRDGRELPSLPDSEEMTEEEKAEAAREALSGYLGIPIRKRGSLLKRLFGRN